LELGLNPRLLPFEFGPVLGILLSSGRGSRSNYRDKPLPDFEVFDSQSLEKLHKLVIDGLFSDPDSRVIGSVVLRASAVNVLVCRTFGRSLELLLSGDDVLAMGAPHQATSEGDLRLVKLSLRDGSALPERLRDRPRVQRCRVPVALEPNLAEIVTVHENAVEDGLVELATPPRSDSRARLSQRECDLLFRKPAHLHRMASQAEAGLFAQGSHPDWTTIRV